MFDVYNDKSPTHEGEVTTVIQLYQINTCSSSVENMIVSCAVIIQHVKCFSPTQNEMSQQSLDRLSCLSCRLCDSQTFQFCFCLHNYYSCCSNNCINSTCVWIKTKYTVSITFAIHLGEAEEAGVRLNLVALKVSSVKGSFTSPLPLTAAPGGFLWLQLVLEVPLSIA